MISKPLFRTGDEVHAFFDDDNLYTVLSALTATTEDGLLVAYSVDGAVYHVAAPDTTEAKRIQPFLEWIEDWI